MIILAEYRKKEKSKIYNSTLRLRVIRAVVIFPKEKILRRILLVSLSNHDFQNHKFYQLLSLFSIQLVQTINKESRNISNLYNEKSNDIRRKESRQWFRSISDNIQFTHAYILPQYQVDGTNTLRRNYIFICT